MLEASPLQRRCVEPVKRMCAGHYGWVVHRFQIKGGLPMSVLWQEAATQWSLALAAATRRESRLPALLIGPEAPLWVGVDFGREVR